MDNKEYLDSIKTIDLSKISLKELVTFDKMLQYYESFSDLSVQREKINQEYQRRKQEGQNDLRFSVHEIRTGYKPEDWGKNDKALPPKEREQMNKRQTKGWNPNFGWKFHLDVVPNRNHPATKDISDFLLNLNIAHKIAAGGENGKGMTVYVGSYDDTCKLAHVIQERFGSLIFKPPFYADQVGQEHAFETKIYGRFCVGKDGLYPQDGLGISPLETSENIENLMQNKAENLGCIKNKQNTCFFNYLCTLFNDNPNYEEIYFTTYCYHKLYAKVYGEYYYGKNLKEFESKFFGAKLPIIGTKKRKTLDEIADVYVQIAKNEGLFERLNTPVNGYIPVDFSRLSHEQQTSYEYIKHGIGRE